MDNTALDAWQPQGTPIHPFDLYELLNNAPISLCEIERCDTSPQAVDEADYVRNLNKIGDVIKIQGRTFFETTSIAPLTKAII